MARVHLKDLDKYLNQEESQKVVKIKKKKETSIYNGKNKQPQNEDR